MTELVYAVAVTVVAAGTGGAMVRLTRDKEDRILVVQLVAELWLAADNVEVAYSEVVLGCVSAVQRYDMDGYMRPAVAVAVGTVVVDIGDLEIVDETVVGPFVDMSPMQDPISSSVQEAFLS